MGRACEAGWNPALQKVAGVGTVIGAAVTLDGWSFEYFCQEDGMGR